MSSPADHTTSASHPGSVPAVQETSHLSRPEGRIGYDVTGGGSLVVLVPGTGDLRAGCRFLGPAWRAAAHRVACTDLRGHGDSGTTFTSYGDHETAGGLTALIAELGGRGQPTSLRTAARSRRALAGRDGRERFRPPRTSHDPAEARLADATAPALVVTGEQHRGFPGPRAAATPHRLTEKISLLAGWRSQ
jgi:hypothetical protein